MLDYLRSFRPLNLLFIGLAQGLTAFFLYFDANLQMLIERDMHWLIIGTLSVAALGYWINDLYDSERDAINRPAKRGPASYPRLFVILNLVLLVLIMLNAAWMLGLRYLLCFGGVSILLWLYNYKLKDVALLGNLIIAFLSFFSVFMVRWLFPEMDVRLLLHFSLLAGLLTLCRELVKDAEDELGDRQTGAKTVAVVMGKAMSNRLVYFLVLFIISFVVISVYYQSQYFAGSLRYLYWLYYLVFIAVPLYKVAIDIRLIQEAEDYARVSRLLKYVIFTGVLSLLFF